MKRLLPWVVAAAFAALSLCLWSRPHLPAPNGAVGSVQDRAAPGPAPESSPMPASQPTDLAPCRLCTERLVATRAALDHCRDERGMGPVDGDLTAEAWSCVERPEVRRFVDSRIEEGIARQAEERTRRREQAREEEEGAVRALLAGSLGLSEEESRFLTEYTCTVRELRRQALEDVPAGGGGSTPDETVRRIEAERSELLADLEGYLGAERYRRLRDIGGLGLLGDVVACNEGEAPTPP